MSIENVRSYFRSLGAGGGYPGVFPIKRHGGAGGPGFGGGARPDRQDPLLSGRGGLSADRGGGGCPDRQSQIQGAFGFKAKMLAPEEALRLTGHAVGGVCPFAVPDTVRVCLDVSLRRFDTVFPACGSANSAIELTCEDLFAYSRAWEWVDVCKSWREGEG